MYECNLVASLFDRISRPRSSRMEDAGQGSSANQVSLELALDAAIRKLHDGAADKPELQDGAADKPADEAASEGPSVDSATRRPLQKMPSAGSGLRNQTSAQQGGGNVAPQPSADPRAHEPHDDAHDGPEDAHSEQAVHADDEVLNGAIEVKRPNKLSAIRRFLSRTRNKDTARRMVGKQTQSSMAWRADVSNDRVRRADYILPMKTKEQAYTEAENELVARASALFDTVAVTLVHGRKQHLRQLTRPETVSRLRIVYDELSGRWIGEGAASIYGATPEDVTSYLMDPGCRCCARRETSCH